MTKVTAVRRRAWGLAIVSTAQFVLQLDYSIVYVPLPTIARKRGFAPAELRWIVTGYAMTFWALLLLGGRIGDRVGQRRVLAAGLVLMSAGLSWLSRLSATGTYQADVLGGLPARLLRPLNKERKL